MWMECAQQISGASFDYHQLPYTCSKWLSLVETYIARLSLCSNHGRVFDVGGSSGRSEGSLPPSHAVIWANMVLRRAAIVARYDKVDLKAIVTKITTMVGRSTSNLKSEVGGRRRALLVAVSLQDRARP